MLVHVCEVQVGVGLDNDIINRQSPPSSLQKEDSLCTVL